MTLVRESPPPIRPKAGRRPIVACLALVAVYVALSFLNDPRGYLGTDTGGKVATLAAMEHKRTLDPDLGYWAERWDPDGNLHPLYYTSHVAGKWVNLTTLPAVYAAYPLFRLGGYRGALLLPMLGSVLVALAARALARRLGSDDRGGWLAFWVVGLASPLAVYALDFWEHSLGVGLLAWAFVLLLDVAEGRAGWRGAAGAGVLFGAAATMRTEALVYAAVATSAACALLVLRRRRLVATVIAGLAVVAGLVLPLAANLALERGTIGTSLRAERAAGTVKGAVAQTEGGRVEEALLTATSPNPALEPSSYLLGAVLFALLLAFAVRAAQGEDGRHTARLAGAGVVALYLIRAVDGLGFVPGMVAATPLAAVGLALGWRRPIPAQDGAGSTGGRRFLLAVALLALPLVWAFQFTGGASPQWGGRYILPSGFLLGVLGVVCLPVLARWARLTVLGLATAVTCFGLAWLSVRSHDVARASAALAKRPEPVLVSRVAHLAREGGWYAGQRRWLTAVDDADEREAARVVTQAGLARLGLVELDVDSRPRELPGFTATAVTRLRYFAGIDLRITTYERVSRH